MFLRSPQEKGRHEFPPTFVVRTARKEENIKAFSIIKLWNVPKFGAKVSRIQHLDSMISMFAETSASVYMVVVSFSFFCMESLLFQVFFCAVNICILFSLNFSTRHPFPHGSASSFPLLLMTNETAMSCGHTHN